ncbi:antitoxin Xre/MbcA/ParS toxin-binding domain-containing protein [Mesorhizobium marinum]|uniref:Antitoxin Xre/MbcA/ParS toxin-binding domain-containing protein n=1 Tax=Mesorhizobium marinum TaxID=3228790 RepID=A0ABV3R412_9HYPH
MPQPKLSGLEAKQAKVLTEAVLRAADRLGVSARALSAVLGVSEATVSRMRRKDFSLERGSKPFELGVLFVRLFRSLDAIVGGDEAVARAWIKNPNSALESRPLEKIMTITGLIDVIAYLDSRRALV